MRHSDGGHFHWCLVNEDGPKLAVSAGALGYARDTQRATADVRLHAGSAAGSEDR
jgi:hypothetical protein